MSTKTTLAIVVVLAAVVGLFAYSSSGAPKDQPVQQAGANQQAAANPAAGAAPAASGAKFADQPYAKSAYEIDLGNLGSLDEKTRQALAGFKIAAAKSADGSVTVSMTSTNPAYHDQSYVVKPGQKFYFIEMSLGDDDDEADEDANLRDDTAVVVDVGGNVVSQ